MFPINKETDIQYQIVMGARKEKGESGGSDKGCS
jgi:hypothetical protein